MLDKHIKISDEVVFSHLVEMAKKQLAAAIAEANPQATAVEVAKEVECLDTQLKAFCRDMAAERKGQLRGAHGREAAAAPRLNYFKHGCRKRGGVRA